MEASTCSSSPNTVTTMDSQFGNVRLAWRMTSMPDRSGNPRSTNKMSGFCVSSMVMPSIAVPTLATTSNSASFARIAPKRSRNAASSSTMSTRGISRTRSGRGSHCTAGYMASRYTPFRVSTAEISLSQRVWLVRFAEKYANFRRVRSSSWSRRIPRCSWSL